MKLNTINIPYVLNSTLEALPPVSNDLGINDPMAVHPASRWLNRLASFFTKAMSTGLIAFEPVEQKKAYESKHGILLDEYPVELLKFEQAYVNQVIHLKDQSVQYDALRPLTSVLTDIDFLTSIECDLDTPYADVILAIQTSSPAAYHPTVEYVGGPKAQYELGLLQDKLSFTKLSVSTGDESEVKVLLDYNSESDTMTVDPDGTIVNTLISSAIPFDQQVRLQHSIKRWLTIIGQHSTPVEVDSLEDVIFDLLVAKPTLGTIHQSYKLPNGTYIASYPTNYIVAEEASKNAFLVLAFAPDQEPEPNYDIYVCTSYMHQQFVTDRFPTFLNQEDYSADVGGYKIKAKDIVAAERLFERFIERKPGVSPLLNGGW